MSEQDEKATNTNDDDSRKTVGDSNCSESMEMGDASETIIITRTDDYFESYGDLNVHRLMLQDSVRTNTYLKAVSDTETLFKDKIVMDVGAGTGILSLFCAKAGAKTVYSVEGSNLAKILPEVAEKNGFKDVIKVIHSKIEDVTILPGGVDEKVDIIVSEWMGFYLLHESMLDSVVYARDKFLKPNGLMYPNSAQIYAAPCHVPEVWKNHVDFWTSQQHYGFDLSVFENLAKNINKPAIEVVPADGILSDPQLLFEINLHTVSSDSLHSFQDRRFFSIETSGEMHGVCLWFSCSFPVVPEKEPVELSTAPWTEETHWKQTIILLPEKLSFEEGDITGWDISLEKGSLDKGSRSYAIHYQCLGDDDEHPVPCDCGLMKCEIIKHYMNSNPINNESISDVQ